MGKSDPIVHKFYSSLIDIEKEYDSVGFFGQPQENSLSSMIRSKKKYFYDIVLGNWNINGFPYVASKDLDLIVCTRCAYFCKDPLRMIHEFKNILKPKGKILVDWGLGDHWRFKDYKVGWVKNGEQEWAYEKENYLWSTVWHDSFVDHPEVKKYLEMIKKHNYEDNLEIIIKREVPCVLDVDSMIKKSLFKKISFDILALWPEDPQLYIALLFEADKQ